MRQFEERPRKVHLFHDHNGETYGPVGREREFVNTLCKGNWNQIGTLTTDDPRKVTCKICRKDHRFRLLLACPQPAPPSEEPWIVDAPDPGPPRTRYRVTRWTRKLVLQVEYLYNNADSSDSMDLGQTVTRWRDATLEDLNVGVVL